MIGGLVKPDRREFLSVSLLGTGALLLGFDNLGGFAGPQDEREDPFRGGKQLGILEFAGESKAPLDTMIGAGLDARLFSDLSRLNPEQLVTPTEEFYVRTTASELLDTSKPWTINVSGPVQEPIHLALEELHKSAKPMGMHLMECSGNTRATRFGRVQLKVRVKFRAKEAEQAERGVPLQRLSQGFRLDNCFRIV